MKSRLDVRKRHGELDYLEEIEMELDYIKERRKGDRL